MNEPVKDVHQGGLAGAVLADQRVDLTVLDAEVDVVVGEHARKLPGDAAHVDRELYAVTHSEPGTYGRPSDAGGVLRPTRPASTTSVITYGSMLKKYCETWIVELFA